MNLQNTLYFLGILTIFLDIEKENFVHLILYCRMKREPKEIKSSAVFQASFVKFLRN